MVKLQDLLAITIVLKSGVNIDIVYDAEYITNDGYVVYTKDESWLGQIRESEIVAKIPQANITG